MAQGKGSARVAFQEDASQEGKSCSGLGLSDNAPAALGGDRSTSGTAAGRQQRFRAVTSVPLPASSSAPAAAAVAGAAPTAATAAPTGRAARSKSAARVAPSRPPQVPPPQAADDQPLQKVRPVAVMWRLVALLRAAWESGCMLWPNWCHHREQGLLRRQEVHVGCALPCLCALCLCCPGMSAMHTCCMLHNVGCAHALLRAAWCCVCAQLLEATEDRAASLCHENVQLREQLRDMRTELEQLMDR